MEATQTEQEQLDVPAEVVAEADDAFLDWLLSDEREEEDWIKLADDTYTLKVYVESNDNYYALFHAVIYQVVNGHEDTSRWYVLYPKPDEQE